MAESDLNLLEWYAAHRGEMGVLRDPSALFALGLLDHVGDTPRGEFQQDLGMDAAQLDQTIEQLYNAGFVTTRGTTLAITPSGKQFLTEIGLSGPLPPPSGTENPTESPQAPKPLPKDSPAKPPVPPAPGTPFWLWGLIGLLIIGILLVFGIWINNRGAEQPTRIAEADTATPFASTRTPTRRAPVTRTPVVVPGTEISFGAEPLTVTPGGCTILAWNVDSALEVLLEGQAVGKQGRQRVCPQETTTFTLSVLSLTNEKLTQTVEVVVTQPRTDYVWTIVDQDPPFNSLRLQYAMAHAVDEPAIAKEVLQGAGGLRNADSKLDALEYDLAEAQTLSKQAQYDGQPVFIVPKQGDASLRIAEYITKYLISAGFDARLVDVESRATILVEPEP